MNNLPPGGQYDENKRPPNRIAAIVKYRPRHAVRGQHTVRARALVGYGAALALLAAGLAVVGITDPSALKTSTASGSSAPSSPPVTVCGNAALLTGPSSAPAGAVTVPAGDNSAMFSGTLPASTTYWFAPGTHTLGTGEYSQIDAGNNDTFIGGPGAIIDGQDKNDFAIAGAGTNVTIEYLTIENFTAPQSQGAVNQNLSSGWVVENSTIQDNPNGAGVMVDHERRAQRRLLDQERPVRVPDLLGFGLGPRLQPDNHQQRDQLQRHPELRHQRDRVLRLHGRGEVLERSGGHGDGQLHPRQ